MGSVPETSRTFDFAFFSNMINNPLKKLLKKREKVDFKDIGKVKAVVQESNVRIDPKNPTGFTGLSPKFQAILVASGLSPNDIGDDYETAFEVVDLHLNGD